MSKRYLPPGYLDVVEALRRADPLRDVMRQSDSFRAALEASKQLGEQARAGLDRAQEASQALVDEMKALGPENQIERATRTLSEQLRALEQKGVLEQVRAFQGNQLAIEAQALKARNALEDVGGLSALSEVLEQQQRDMDRWYRPWSAESMAQFNWVELERRYALTGIEELQRSSLAMHSAFEQYARVDLMADLPAGLAEFPRLESFAAVDVLAELVTSEEAEEEGEESTSRRTELRLDAQGHVDARLIPALQSRDARLVKMLHGAREALASRNPDRIRHFVSSQRALLTHLLHDLAPDAEVKVWISSATVPGLLHNGRPTRKARLLYIARGIDHQSFSLFLEADVASAVALFDLLNKGDHVIDMDLTDAQATALLQRVELLLLFLLQTSHISDPEPPN